LSYVRQNSAGPSQAIYTIAHGGWRTANNGARPKGDVLPHDMWPGRPRPTQTVVVVAREVEWARVSGQGSGGSGRWSVVAGHSGSQVLPWVYRFKNEGFPGLVGVLSNIANLALWTARQIMRAIGRLES